MTPKITSVDAGTDANMLGQAAWGVLSKNFWFKEDDKSFMANEIARKYQAAIIGKKADKLNINDFIQLILNFNSTT